MGEVLSVSAVHKLPRTDCTQFLGFLLITGRLIQNLCHWIVFLSLPLPTHYGFWRSFSQGLVQITHRWDTILGLGWGAAPLCIPDLHGYDPTDGRTHMGGGITHWRILHPAAEVDFPTLFLTSGNACTLGPSWDSLPLLVTFGMPTLLEDLPGWSFSHCLSFWSGMGFGIHTIPAYSWVTQIHHIVRFCTLQEDKFYSWSLPLLGSLRWEDFPGFFWACTLGGMRSLRGNRRFSCTHQCLPSPASPPHCDFSLGILLEYTPAGTSLHTLLPFCSYYTTARRRFSYCCPAFLTWEETGLSPGDLRFLPAALPGVVPGSSPRSVHLPLIHSPVGILGYTPLHMDGRWIAGITSMISWVLCLLCPCTVLCTLHWEPACHMGTGSGILTFIWDTFHYSPEFTIPSYYHSPGGYLFSLQDLPAWGYL